MPARVHLHTTALIIALSSFACAGAPRASTPTPTPTPVAVEAAPIVIPLPAPEPKPSDVVRLPPPAALSVATPDEVIAARRLLHASLIQSTLSTATPSEEKLGKRQRRIARKRSIPVGELRVVLSDGVRHDIVLYDAEGRMRPEGWQELDALLAPSQAPLQPRLAALLYLVCRDTDRPVHVFNPLDAEPQHRHISGDALDIYVDNISGERLRDHIQARFEDVGVGYQLNTRMLHIDLREHALYWTDFSRPGRAGIERFEQPETLPEAGSDPTLLSPHLTISQLYPADHPLKASEVREEEEKKKGKKSRKKKRSSGKYHRVKKGETLSEIAARYDVSVKQLVRWNKIKDPAKIRRGEKLRVRK